MTLLLVCVFGVVPGSPGVTKRHTITPNQYDHLANIRFEASAARDPASFEIARTHSYETRLCRATFGSTPDLTWVEWSKP